MIIDDRVRTNLAFTFLTGIKRGKLTFLVTKNHNRKRQIIGKKRLINLTLVYFVFQKLSIQWPGYISSTLCWMVFLFLLDKRVEGSFGVFRIQFLLR